MKRWFRRLLAAVEGGQKALEDVRGVLLHASERVADAAALQERIEDLELSRAKWEAELEGLVLKAESTLKASNNSEARTRTMKKSYAHLIDHGESFGSSEVETELERQLQDRDAEVVPEEGMQRLHLDVAPGGKVLATQWKFQK